MAKAEIIFPEPEPVGVTLHLKMEEAEVLRSLLWRAIIGKSRGPRGTLDGIANALQDAGVEATHRYRGERYLNVDGLERY